jgi:hypothetical protein
MLHHEISVNKRQIALTAGFVGYALKNKYREIRYGET